MPADVQPAATLEEVARAHLRCLGVKPDPQIPVVVQLARWALRNRDQVAVMKSLRYPLGQFLDRLESEPADRVNAWMEQGQPLDSVELMEMPSESAAAECLEKVRLRMSAEGMLDQVHV